MKKGDIIYLPYLVDGRKKLETPYRAKVLAVGEGARAETFLLEYIEGPIDGACAEFTRAELDAIMERPGGEEWKQP